jgi:hypothetical protein
MIDGLKRALGPGVLAFEPSPARARLALDRANPRDIVCVAGSMFLAGRCAALGAGSGDPAPSVGVRGLTGAGKGDEAWTSSTSSSTQRAMRRLKTDDVPDELVWKVLRAATMAPSGGNRQPWNFIVVRDAEKRRAIGAWYLEAWEQAYAPAREAMLRDPGMARTYRSADHLARPRTCRADLRHDPPRHANERPVAALGARNLPACRT